LYALFLRKQFDRLDNKQKYGLIDFAPSLALSKWIRKHPFIEYVTIDLYRGDVDINVDIMDMRNFEDNSIDMFLCSHILEHVPDDRKAMRELYRILKPGGFGILMVPIVNSLPTTHEDATKTTPEERTKFFAQGDHLRLYERRDYVKRLEGKGFLVNQYDIDFFGTETFHKHGIHENSVLYVVEK
jgi:predicted SAM-dependent methyltransferase